MNKDRILSIISRKLSFHGGDIPDGLANDIADQIMSELSVMIAASPNAAPSDNAVLQNFCDVVNQEGEEPSPIERLRFFCSLAMNGQDWVDVEPFFDALEAPVPQAGMVMVPSEPTEEMLVAARDWSAAKFGKPVGNDGATGCYRAMLAASPNAAPQSSTAIAWGPEKQNYPGGPIYKVGTSSGITMGQGDTAVAAPDPFMHLNVAVAGLKYAVVRVQNCVANLKVVK